MAILGAMMDQAVSAANANRRFSKLLRGVREGRSYVITWDGRMVARMVAADKGERLARGARSALLKRLRSQRVSRPLDTG